MNRRKYLAALGVLGSGTAAAMGTGAFTSTSASRDVSVSVADDTNGYLGLSASPNENGEFASVDTSSGGDGEIALDFGASDGGGSGVGLNSTYNFDDVFRIENQGTQTIYVWANFSGEDLDDDDIWFYPGSNSDRELNDGSNSVVTLTTGQQVNVGVHIDTSEALSSTDDQALTASLTADVDVPGGSQPSGPAGEDAAVVSKDADTGEFDSIQEAINSVDGTTVLVESGRYEESVTIDVDGLTLEAAEGASPTVDASGIDGGSIPVLVDADGVTVDDANIDFNSGIDVGADFSDYEPVFEPDTEDVVVGDTGNGADYDSIGAAIDTEGANTDILVKSDYDSSNEVIEDDNGFNLINIDKENVRVVSEEGPDKTEITVSTDNGSEVDRARVVDIRSEDVVVQGFDITSPGQEAIFVLDTPVDASGIKIRDNKVQSDNSGILVGGFDTAVATTNGILIANNKIEHKRNGISFSGTEGDKPVQNNPIIRRNTIIGTVTPANDLPIIAGIALGFGNATVTNATVEANLVETSYQGFRRDDDGDTVDSLTNNHFIGNTYGVKNDVSGDLDATENWFGTEDRDTVEGQIGGSGGDTDFDPFAGVPIDPDAGN
ncbi:hypothetical protein DJ79_10615 [Halorubrum ezzemoulense]|uniref:DUF1565 domain-containing protein n=1 Tax=Halorubrum ezzemoulense TaxID=337243 RepID=A0A256JRN6_HALEZ|nr:DUF1102 domain-containing protein [Halorubrum ezzemoulense]OYR66920.1 hypothetical protein DJ79_10615 [Halorubrum ezzemoulense]OYR71042.1 hypothetical protein DJ76_15585 [Halorubrum ezzemoulense]